MSNADLFTESWEEVATRVLRRGVDGLPPAPEIGDVQEAVMAFMQKRPAKFEGK